MLAAFALAATPAQGAEQVLAHEERCSSAGLQRVCVTATVTLEAASCDLKDGLWDCTMALQVDTAGSGAATLSAIPLAAPGGAFAGTPQELHECFWADPRADEGLTSRACSTSARESHEVSMPPREASFVWYNVVAAAYTAYGNPEIELTFEVREHYQYPDAPTITATLVG